MSMQFDATLKDLGAGYPGDFLAAFDRPATQPVRLLNVDLSTVTTAADFVIGIGDPLEEILHIDFQSSADANKDADVLVYNGLLYRQYRVAVHSILVLLRPQAAHSDVNGTVGYAARPGRGRMDFGFEIIPLWQRSVEDLLAGPLGTLPLAVLAALPEGVQVVEGLTAVVQQMAGRLQQEAPPAQAERLLTAAFVLSGLRVKRNVGRQVFTGVRAMRDSDTFMSIIDEGREVQIKKDIRRLAQKFVGQPDEQTLLRLEGITDLDHLERIFDRATEAGSWQGLLDTP